MSETPSQHRTIPARRKTSRQNNTSAAKKAYASENDVAVLETPHRHAPKTPNRKDEISTPATDFYSSQRLNSKSRTKHKTKPKNVPPSPDPALYGRQTPPLPSAASNKSGISTAFAGATFHASPAPSALPIPSFVSKSSSELPVSLGKDTLQEPSPPATDGDVPSPFRPSSVPKMSESPLDFMFRAHREEKERNFRENPQSHSLRTSKTPQPLQRSDMGGPPKPSSLPHQRRGYFRQPAGGIDPSELDGIPGRPLGPAFSTPYQERIKAVRSSSNSNTLRSQSQTVGYFDEFGAVEDSTEALKKFLFGNEGSVKTEALRPAAGKEPALQTMASPDASISTGPDSGVKNSRASNLEEMENDLRRILKLDMAFEPGSEGRAPFTR
ncbi:hypothetical protein NOR_07176 [Metarhizium rileyi]|uniref:Proteophosphoglycan 5 n=1 Tax=Metarhizium rileyi (strain RCEF 4871) TaxID=1649241 RepID=A0A166Z2D8_METRR|nr:hypothetical protein NOR_07176 [Metarhizium rileyi RCEF 4871]TWU73281.1 hypothetical protein ED733_003065 [Metarhizium rileyi]